jgi:hypothetical protein
MKVKGGLVAEDSTSNAKIEGSNPDASISRK